MRSDALAAAEDGRDALLGPQRLVVAAQQAAPLPLGQLARPLPAPVGDLLAGSEAEADGEGPGGIDVRDVGVAGGGPVGVQGAVEVLRRLGGERRGQLTVGDDPLQPRLGRLAVRRRAGGGSR